MYTVKDSFDAANKINQILPDIHNSDEYVFVSLDVVSLFTNVPLKKTVDIYTGKEIETTLTKRSLKKLIFDTCQKTAFSFNGKMYEQTDGVSMGGSLGPVLANIIMTECEKVIVNQLIENNIVKFYIRYVDDTLLVLKKKDIDIVLNKFNSFNKNLKLTVDTSENCVTHFLDIEICPNGLGIYHKNTQTGQYTNIESFTLWKWETSWITSLTIRAERICSRYHLDQEINLIKDYAAWNGFPKRIAKSIIKRALQANNSNTARSKKANADSIKIFFNLNYSGETVERMIKSCIKKLYRSFKREVNVKFVTHYKTTKMSFFTNTKDKTSSLSQSSVVYQFTCPGCSCNYIGKTERNLHERTEEHAYCNKKSNEQSAIYEHLSTCSRVAIVLI